MTEMGGSPMPTWEVGAGLRVQSRGGSRGTKSTEENVRTRRRGAKWRIGDRGSSPEGSQHQSSSLFRI